MDEKTTLSNAYHEAGHCIIAELHSVEFKIRKLSLDPNFLKDKGDDWKGGFGFRFKNPRTDSTDLAEKTVQVYLAGIAAATIHEKGTQFVNAHLSLFPRDSRALQTRGADIDYNEAKSLMKQIASVCAMEPIQAFWTSFSFVFQFLLHQAVWASTEALAIELHNAKNQTLEEDQIRKILLESGFSDFIDKHGPSILSGRYPLTCDKLLLNN